MFEANLSFTQLLVSSTTLALVGFIFLTYLVSKTKKVVKHDYKTKVSIIIPAYNSEKTIKKCLEKIFLEDYKKEVIIADDGSEDNTVKIAKQFPVKILKFKHSGKNKTLNKAIKKAKNEIILVIDSDTFIEKGFIKEMVKPFQNKKVAAVSGMAMPKTKNLLSFFQEIEYIYINIARKSFSRAFHNSIWFFGAIAAYRKKYLEEVGGFCNNCLAEDSYIELKLLMHNYLVVHAPNAKAKTIVPQTLKELLKQRMRWWNGGLQAMIKNRKVLTKKVSANYFHYINHSWFYINSFISIPLTAILMFYWFPLNQSFLEQLFYLFRWTNLSGPLYALYKLKEWNYPLHLIPSITLGILMPLIQIIGLKEFKIKPKIHHLIAIVFYFPYTLILNIITIISLFRFKLNQEFVR